MISIRTPPRGQQAGSADSGLARPDLRSAGSRARRHWTRSALVIFPVLLLGCGGEPLLVANYASATCSDQRAQARVSKGACDAPLTATVGAILAPAPPPASRSGTTFSEHALAAYINALAQPRLGLSAREIRANLAAPVVAEQERSSFLDSSYARGLLTVTVASTGDFAPVDRIERATITVELLEAEYTDWVSARTIYSEVTPGSIQATSQTVLRANAGVSVPTAVPVTLGGSVESTRGRSERFEPVLQVEDITVRIERKREHDSGKERAALLVIERSGGIGRDLRGNAQVEVTLRSLPDSALASVYRVQNSEGSDLPRLTLQTRRFLAQPIRARLHIDYVVRHILAGGETVEQIDDHVQFIRRSEEQPDVVIAPAAVLYGLMSRHGQHSGYLRIRRHTNDRRGVELCFDREEDARAMQDYLYRARPRRVAGLDIGFVAGRVLGPPEHDAGYNVGDRCGEWGRLASEADWGADRLR